MEEKWVDIKCPQCGRFLGKHAGIVAGLLYLICRRCGPIVFCLVRAESVVEGGNDGRG